MKLLHKKIVGCLAVPFLALILMRAMFLFYDFLFQANLANSDFDGGILCLGVFITTIVGVSIIIQEGDKFL